ncbi:MAG: hypothetical protein J3K34DRAFT_467901 [Monoraphidium minutum]|nr:MAG: hypothetical protein J3K34DRAFT_467901 [Monoraphidium minutum]
MRAGAAKKSAPAKPTRPLSAYTMFIKKTSSQWFAPGTPAPESIKRASAAWKALSDGERAPYVAAALEAAEAARGARADAAAEAKAARAPPPAYAAFMAEEIKRLLAARPGTHVTGLMKEVAAAWRALPEADKTRRKLAADRARTEWNTARLKSA